MARTSLTIGIGVGAVLAAILAFTALGQEFLPQLDEGDLTAQILRVPGTSVDQSQAMQSRIEREIAKLPEVRSIGRASCRERVGQYVSLSVAAVTLKNKQTTKKE